MILCFACGNYNIVLTCHIYTHIHIRMHAHTQSRTFKCCDFLEILQNEIQEQLRQCWSAKFNTRKCMFFKKNIRSKKTSGQIERYVQKYLHHLNKMIEKCKVRKFIFSEVSYFYPANLLKNEPFHRIIAKFLPRFWMATCKLWYIVNSFNRYY